MLIIQHLAGMESGWDHLAAVNTATTSLPESVLLRNPNTEAMVY
jgi:hypothetical protein